jgi:hypothetical protein
MWMVDRWKEHNKLSTMEIGELPVVGLDQGL